MWKAKTPLTDLPSKESKPQMIILANWNVCIKVSVVVEFPVCKGRWLSVLAWCEVRETQGPNKARAWNHSVFVDDHDV